MGRELDSADTNFKAGLKTEEKLLIAITLHMVMYFIKLVAIGKEAKVQQVTAYIKCVIC